MAMKIKKRRPKGDSEEPEVVNEEEEYDFDDEDGDEEQQLKDISEAGPDAFDAAATLASYSVADWVERNAKNILIGIIVTTIAAIAIYVVLEQTQKKKEAGGEVVFATITPYTQLVEGSPTYDQLKKNTNFKMPKKIFKTEKDRWEAIIKEADTALKSPPTPEAGQSARLSKAAASVNLGKFDDAIKVYEEYRKGKVLSGMEPFVHFGLAQAYAGKKQTDKAVAELDKLAKSNKKFFGVASYRKGLLLEGAGKTKEAKETYHAIIEKDPKSPYKSDIERRLAIL